MSLRRSEISDVPIERSNDRIKHNNFNNRIFDDSKENNDVSDPEIDYSFKKNIKRSVKEK